MRIAGFGKCVLSDVSGMWYQPGGGGGSGLSPASALMMLVKPAAGFAGKLRERACGRRAVRARRKERIGDMVVGGKEGQLQANAGTENLGGGKTQKI